MESCRPELYLDGHESILWTFRNQILQKREDRLYVDYVRTDDGRHWATPAYELSLLGDAGEPLYSGPQRLAEAFHNLGIENPDALAVVAKIWRAVNIADNLDICEIRAMTKRTLDELDGKRFLVKDTEAMAIVIDRWLFPLYALDLRPLEVDKKELKEARQAEANRFYEEF